MESTSTQLNIYYSGIFYKESKVLCDYTEFYGNIQQAALKISQEIKRKNFKGSISFDSKYTFHYYDENNITYICLSDKNYPIEIAHGYLSQLKNLLLNNFTLEQIRISDSYALDQLLKVKLKQKQLFFSQDFESLNKIKEDLINKQNNALNDNNYNLLGKTELNNIIESESLLLFNSLNEVSLIFFNKIK